MNSFHIKSMAVLTVFLVMTAYATNQVSAKRTPVEVWSGGDDGLTQGLRVAIENMFESSPDFKLSHGKQPGTLIVTIPTHVRWKEIGTRTKIFYIVECTSAENQNIGSYKGSCWSDALAKCTDQIMKEAKVAMHKIR